MLSSGRLQREWVLTWVLISAGRRAGCDRAGARPRRRHEPHIHSSAGSGACRHDLEQGGTRIAISGLSMVMQRQLHTYIIKPSGSRAVAVGQQGGSRCLTWRRHRSDTVLQQAPAMCTSSASSNNSAPCPRRPLCSLHPHPTEPRACCLVPAARTSTGRRCSGSRRPARGARSTRRRCHSRRR